MPSKGDGMERSAGVLLHPTCLPSRYGIGDFGPVAENWLEWLGDAGVRWWQILPLHPPGAGESPYSAISTLAGNPLLISPELLLDDGLLVPEDLASAPAFPDGSVDFGAVISWKTDVLRRAFASFDRSPSEALAADLEMFRADHGWWLDDFTLFEALKRAHGGAPWYRWPEPLARRDSRALEAWRVDHESEVALAEFCQLLFFRQWEAVRRAAREEGVRILGDVPIFVARDSADVWSHPEIFKLDDALEPTVVAGVPPDYFSSTGQLWGNPVYDWARLADDGYGWWLQRLRHELGLVDAVRLDHFRGFAACWEVPAADETATGGRWVPGPGRALFEAVRSDLGELPFVAEDLGEITPDVIELRKHLGLPGMAILQFGFSPGPRSTFIPYSLERDLVVYTGTHDNNTTVGWYREDASEQEKDLVRRYAASDGSEIHWDMIRLALSAVSDLAVIPHQDLVGLGSEGRMNRPAQGLGNWRFRITEDMLGSELRYRLAEALWVYGRRVEESAEEEAPPS
jgi:4-alpha-glucanotransferase